MNWNPKSASPLRSGGRRELFKRSLGLAIFSKVWWKGEALGSVPSASITRGPYLQSAGSDTISICWRSSIPTTSEVRLRLPGGEWGGIQGPAGTRVDHLVRLQGLAPATRYLFSCGGTDAGGTRRIAEGPDFVFSTAPAPGAKASGRFWVLGDCGSHPSVPWGFPESTQTTARFLSDSVASGRPIDGVLLLGDNAYNIGSDSEYQAAVFTKYATLLRRSPVWSTFGNHDAYTLPYPFTGNAPYDSIFAFPLAGECGGVASGSGRYYSFDHGNIHFICLDNNTLGYYDKKPGQGGMIDWLITDLKACSADWIVAFFHHPPYSKGTHDSDTQWNLVRARDYIVPLLERYGVDLVLCGHSHQYQRSCLIDGHYGNSSTFDTATMRKWTGNGSETGAINAQGAFVVDPVLAHGPYQKPAATGRGGAVYAVIGSSGKVDAWPGGATSVVNPTPHPVHVANLRIIGGLAIEIDGNKLHAEYRDSNGALRDEFNIVKGSRFEIVGTQPAFVSPSQPGAAIHVRRAGATAFADSVSLLLSPLAGTPSCPPRIGVAFASGQTEVLVSIPGLANGDAVEVSIERLRRKLEPDCAERDAYRFADAPATLRVATTPAATWYASRFGQPPPNPQVWDSEPDGDGYSLLMKYALGMEPGTPANHGGPGWEMDGADMVLAFLIPPGRTDLIYRVEDSGDGRHWRNLPIQAVATGPDTPLGSPREFRVARDGEKCFYRLAVSRVP